MKPTIQSVSFGDVAIDGKTYAHDVVILSDGRVLRRKKKASRKKFGTGHRLARAELAKYFGSDPPALLIVGTGHANMLRFSNGSIRFLMKHRIKAEFFPTPKAMRRFNEAPEETAALIHVTC